MQKNTKLGWIGLGVMGEPMCQHLMAAGFPMSVTTRSKEKASRVLNDGALWCDSAVDVARQSDIVFTMVGLEQDVRDVYFSASGLFKTNISDKIFIDMGTTAPSLTLEISQYAKDHGAHSIDAPVSGGDVGAKNASLSIMAGGDEHIIEQVKYLFEYLGRVQIMGVAGSGQHTKVCNQIVIAGTMIGVCEALLYAKRAGLNCETLIAAIRPGAAGCWTLDNLAPRIVRQDFSPGFMVDHFIKDLAIAVKEAEGMNLDLPALSLVKSLYEKVRDIGHGKSGTQALLLALEDCTETIN
jgi:3-hydroxyisobutyrate dehydrogenase